MYLFYKHHLYKTSYLSHSEILIRKPIWSSKKIPIHPKFWSGEFLEISFFDPDKIVSRNYIREFPESPTLYPERLLIRGKKCLPDTEVGPFISTASLHFIVEVLDILNRFKSVQFKILFNHQSLAIISITWGIFLVGLAQQLSETGQQILWFTICSEKAPTAHILSLNSGKWFNTTMLRWKLLLLV